jgi:putative sugar O-methyltransferase
MALTISLLSKHIPNLDAMTFCIIGDGYGPLGCLIKKIFPDSKIVYVTLGRTLLFDAYYSHVCFPGAGHALVSKGEQWYLADFNYIEAENFESNFCKANVFISIASMQEMDYEAIATYFDAIRSQSSSAWFYCCNRISKSLPDETMINFANYG